MPEAKVDPAMVQRVAADVVASTPDATPQQQKVATIAAVNKVLAGQQPYVQAGQSIIMLGTVAAGVVGLVGGLFGKAKAGVARARELRAKLKESKAEPEPSIAEEPAPTRKRRTSRRRR